jgi:hypothetical protein
MRRKPILKKGHIQKRKEFVKKYMTWNEKNWGRVLWSDETKINLHGSDGRKCVFRRKVMQAKYDLCVRAVKHPQSVMVWACFSSKGPGAIHFIDGTMDKYQYTRILESHVMKEGKRLCGNNFYFQSDNDPKHTSHYAKEWVKRKKLKTLCWPPCSPDMSPIENLFHILKEKLREKDIGTKKELEREIEVTWNSIPVQTCQNLIESMPNRLKNLDKAKGMYTDY